MGIRSLLSIPLSWWVSRQVSNRAGQAVTSQKKILHQLIRTGKNTAFGKTHRFDLIKNYSDFKKAVPLRQYEDFKPWIDRIIKGESHVLWPGKPMYFAKTSGTTSGTKYIPITRDSITTHIAAARNALLLYIARKGNSNFADGKMMFLSGSPRLELKGGIPTGRLSGIVNHHVPAYLKGNQLPSFATNCIEDWNEKLECIIGETLHADLRLISGIPPWVQMYFEKLIAKTGKTVGEIFPNLSVFVHGGVNYSPYEQKIRDLIGRDIDTIETYPASEGFIAYQDTDREAGLLLNSDGGMFFEFVPAGEIHSANPARLSLEEVEPGINYAVIINSNAGLWGYILGDTVRFTSVKPYRLNVTGRIHHYISAFGEHVIAEEVEDAIREVSETMHIQIREFTVAPVIQPASGLPYHEWFIEFEQMPADLNAVENALDAYMCQRNIYYRDLRTGNTLRTLRITPVKRDGFRHYMDSIGKLGGQNKIPHLSNDRKFADGLQTYIFKPQYT